MSTTNELYRQERQASARSCRAEMRRAALGFRLAISPGFGGSLTERGEQGVHELLLAMSYRGYARQCDQMAAAFAN